MSFSWKVSLSLCIACSLFCTALSHAATVIDPSLPAELPDVGATAPLVSVAYSSDGDLLYTLGTTGELIGRKVSNQRTVIRGNVGDNSVKMRILPDESLLIGRSNGDVSWYEKPIIGKPLAQRGVFPAPKAKAPVNDPTGKNSIEHESVLEDFVPSPNGALLAIATTETTWKTGYRQRQLDARTAHLQVWDMRSKSIVHIWEPIPLTTLPRRRGARDSLHLAWEGKTLTVAMPDVTVQRFDPHTGALQSEWKPPAKDALTPDSAAKDAAMRRRFAKLPPDARDKAEQAYERRKAAGNPESSSAKFGQTQAISQDGNLLLTATPNGWQLWNIKSNSNVILEQSQRLTPNDTAQFSADDTMLALHSAGRFWAWRSDGTQIGFAHVPIIKFSGLAFSPNGKYFSLGDDTGTARQWKVETPLPQTASVVFPGFFDPWRQLSFAPNLMLTSTDRFVASLDVKGNPHWFAHEPIKLPEPLSDNEKTFTRVGINNLLAAPNGKSWAEYTSYETYTSTMGIEGIPRGELRERDAKTGQIIWRQADKSPGSSLNVLRFLPDGTLLTGGRGRGRSARSLPDSFGGLNARDKNSGEPAQLGIEWEQKIGYQYPYNVEILLTSRDGKHLVVSSGSGGDGIQVIDMTSKKIVLFFGANTTIERGAWALSPDGQWLGVAAKDHVDLWDLNKPRTKYDSKPNVRLEVSSLTQALSFGNDNSVAVGLSDGRILLWAPNPTPDALPIWETKPGRGIDVLQFSIDGKTLWSGDERGDLKTRDAQNGQLQSTLRLLPPTSEDGAPSWVRWTRDGEIENSRG